jgi:hypothetical protein
LDIHVVDNVLDVENGPQSPFVEPGQRAHRGERASIDRLSADTWIGDPDGWVPNGSRPQTEIRSLIHLGSPAYSERQFQTALAVKIVFVDSQNEQTNESGLAAMMVVPPSDLSETKASREGDPVHPHAFPDRAARFPASCFVLDSEKWQKN